MRVLKAVTRRISSAALKAGLVKGADSAARRRLDAALLDPQVLIEITSKCNFACDYCSSAFLARKKVDMSRELFEQVARQLPALTTKRVRLHIDGEPTLHPRFHEIVSLLNEKGLKVGLATNGSLLKPEWLDLDMELVITVSTDPAEFATRNNKLDFDAYSACVAEYVHAWARSDSPQKLMLQLIHNHAGFESGQADERWGSSRDDFIQRAGLAEHCQPEADRPWAFRKASGHAAILIKYPIAVGGLYPVAGEVIEYPPVKRGFCDSAWKRLAVLADGRVSYCCVDLSGGTAYTDPDDIWNKPLREIWLEHPHIREVREGFARGDVLDSICKTCLAGTKFQRREVGFNT